MLRVAEAMVPDPFRVGPWTSVREAARLMAQRRVGSLVVVEDGQVLGVVTSRDLRGAHPNRLVVDVLKVPRWPSPRKRASWRPSA